VSVSIPYALPLPVVALNYTVRLSPGRGMSAVGPAVVKVPDGSFFMSGDAHFTYSINPGWAADEALPVGSLLFAVAFILLAFHKVEEEPEEEEQVTGRLGDAIKAFEERLALVNSSMEEIGSKQSSKADLDRVKGDLDLLKSRALQRLNEVRQTAESKRYTDLLAQIQDAEREEDRATKDLLNLYEQYYGKRMREETFQRLLPNYKKRLGSTVNHLSDLLNLAQKEG
jgi:hypothetical protein